MKRIVYLILLFNVIYILSCEEEQIYNFVNPSIKIVEPLPKFITEEYDKILVRVETNVPDAEIEKIEIIYWAKDLWEDTTHIFIEERPFEDSLYIPKICVESTYLFITAKLYFLSGKTVNSDTVWGYYLKNLPSNDEMNIYDYQGFDNDSVLVATGTLTIIEGFWPIEYTNTILGRRDIIAITGDSVFEKGKGYLEGFVRQNGLFTISLTPCGELPGLERMSIDGTLISDSLLNGYRYFLPLHGPSGIKLGTFRAVRIN